MVVKSYKELVVWQKAMRVACLTYELVKKLPKEECFALSSQMRRAAVSIPSNIAEGQSRHSLGEFLHFLSIANGSRAELETQLLLCVEIHYMTSQDIAEALSLLQEIAKIINALISKFSSR